MSYWLSPVPEKCDICDAVIDVTFYDMKTNMGPWACMCTACATLGPGIGKTGLGLGQKYSKKPDGKFHKTEG